MKLLNYFLNIIVVTVINFNLKLVLLKKIRNY